PMGGPVAAPCCSAVLGSAVLRFMASSSSLAVAQQKTAKSCLTEWRANKAANGSNRVTKKAYVAQCRAPGAPTGPGAAGPVAADLVVGSGTGIRAGQVYSSIKDLMESIIDQSADAHWGAVGSVADNEGVHESFPKTTEAPRQL